MWQYGGCLAGPSCQTGWYSSPAVADLDGDGQPDVIWVAYGAVAALENDGQLELIAGTGGSSSSFQRSAYEPSGTVRLGWPVCHTGDPGSGSGLWNQNVVVADMSGDGFKEVFTTTGSHYVTGV